MPSAHSRMPGERCSAAVRRVLRWVVTMLMDALVLVALLLLARVIVEFFGGLTGQAYHGAFGAGAAVAIVAS
jgi:hypothetical protein